MNNNDERDYAEEAANRQLLQEEADDAEDAMTAAALVVPAVAALVASPETPAMLSGVSDYLRLALRAAGPMTGSGGIVGDELPYVDPAELDDRADYQCPHPNCCHGMHCGRCGGSYDRSGTYGCICDMDETPHDLDEPGAWCDERCNNCGTC